MDQVENKVEEQNIQQQPAQAQAAAQEQPQQQETDKDINWKKWKEAREKERREAAEIARQKAEKEAEAAALRAALEAVVSKQNQTQQSHEEEESEEQRLNKRVEQIIAQREAEAERKRKEKEQQELPQRITEVFPDYASVCSNENMDYLQYHYPEVASAFKYAPDNFETWSAVYKAIKRFVPNTDTKKDLARSEKNMQKPQSPSRPGLSQSANPPSPVFLTEERRRQNWERMQREMKGLS